MKKYKLEVTRKNGNKRKVSVYLDDTTAALLEKAGDKKLLRTYLIEEYKASRKARREEYWNQSLDEDLENGIDYEDKRSYSDFSFNDMDDENLQVVIEQLTPRQQEILRFKYIDAGAPLYLKTARYAREHGESEQYHRSHELNNACREEMDKAISENFDGMHLKEGFERELMERYGRERVEYLLATTVKENAWDGRYSRENRKWVESIPVSESESERIACCLHSHPAVIDGLIRWIRRNEHKKQPKKTSYKKSSI